MIINRTMSLGINNGSPIEISSEEEMATILDDVLNIGKLYRYIGSTGTYIYGGLYLVVNAA